MARFRLLALLAGVSALAGGLTTTRAQDDKSWGSIKGQIILTNPPAPVPINVTTDKMHCLSKGPLVSDNVIVDPKTNGVKNVVVWLRPDNANRNAPFPANQIKPALAKAAPKQHVVDQPCCQFIPKIVAARTGDTLEFKNSAPVAHNINYSSDAETFNVTLPSGKSFMTQPLVAQTTPIPFKCDIHPWMAGRVRVFDHPYFAITDASGNFEIKDAPPGKWRLVIWHEDGFHKGREGALGMPVEVSGGSTTELKPVNLELPNNPPPPPAKN